MGLLIPDNVLITEFCPLQCGNFSQMVTVFFLEVSGQWDQSEPWGPTETKLTVVFGVPVCSPACLP